MDDRERISHLVGRNVAGRFTIEAHVGGGAMGDVFRARHNALGSAVALKIMRSEHAKEDNFRERFYREAKAASRLEHPNSVRVIDFGTEPDGLVYLAMEFLAGRDLLTLLREEWPITDSRIVDILGQALSALTVAHGFGIVHRDLKPENIMVSSVEGEDGVLRDHVKVCDFGIAKLSDPRAFQTENSGKALTTSGTLIGTPEYMSPEQARGEPLDLRSDIYSVGIILYQMLAGRVPFTGENAIGIIVKHVTDTPLWPSAVRPEANRKLEAVCLRAMEKSPDKRYASAREMRADLRAAIGRSVAASLPDDSGPHRQGPFNGPMESAPTVVSAPAASSPSGSSTLVQPHARAQFEPKQTSDGAAVPVPNVARRSRAGLFVGVALIALFTGGLAAVGVAVAQRAKPTTPVATNAPVASTPEAPPASDTGAPPLTPADTTMPVATSTVATTHAPPVIGRPSPKASAHASASAPASAHSGVPPSASAPPSVSASAAPEGPPAAAYNPTSAFVSYGGLSVERVQRDAVQRKMNEVLPRLSECYRSSLRNLGAPVGGAGAIHVSIDEKGAMQAIVTAPKNSEFARCAQNTLAGQRVPASAVESSGATASQIINLVP